MWTQLIQMFDMLTLKSFHLLAVFFLVTTCATAIYAIAAKNHKDVESTVSFSTSAIVPVYNENPNVLQEVLSALKKQVNQLIVVADKPTKEHTQIIKEYADDYVFNENKSGKRNALNQGLTKVKYEITLLVDSDAVLSVGAVKQILKAFSKNNVGLVQGRTFIKNDSKSKFSILMGKLTENSRDVVCRALSPHLIVADGRFQAIKTDVFKQIAPKCVSDTFLGRKMLTGDDRQRTRLVHKLGFESIYQSMATCTTIAQPTFKLFIKQQLRWMRSGYIYFMKDLVEWNIPSKLYAVKSIHYYLGPMFFVAAVVGDLFFLPPISVNLPVFIIPVAIVVGVSVVTLLKHLLMFGVKRVEYRWIPFFGVYGLFIAMPLMVYGLITVKKACTSWETR